MKSSKDVVFRATPRIKKRSNYQHTLVVRCFLLTIGFFLMPFSLHVAWGAPDLRVDVDQVIQNPIPVNFNTSAYQGIGPVVTINNILVTNVSLDTTSTGFSSTTQVKFYLIYPYPQPYIQYLNSWRQSYAPYSNPLDPANPNWTIVPTDSRTVLFASVSIPPLGDQISCE